MLPSCLAIIYLLFITSILSHTDDHQHHPTRRIHKCSDDHHRIQKGVNLHQIHVPYKNHPYDKTIKPSSATQTNPSNRRRSLLSEAETSPIRVSAYYDPATIENARTAVEIATLKSVIGAIVNYYQETIKVVPVDGTFYMERFCESWWWSGGTEDYVNCRSYDMENNTVYCQYATVPNDHLAEQWLFEYNSNTFQEVLPAGKGNL